MGLTIDTVEAIFREHRYQPIEGDVLLIGRQTVYFTPSEILALMKTHNIASRLSQEELVIDKQTLSRRKTTKNELISDTSLFRMLGAQSVRALDHSGYEGAEVIHDLTKPLPAHLHNIADFIVDGSTLDNTFDPAMTIKNYSALLRPGGRVILYNILSNHHEPYSMLPPLWYHDFFIFNKFVDCKVYILVFKETDNLGVSLHNTFCINTEWLMNPHQHVGSFTSPYEMELIVFAEKGDLSTNDKTPAQQHYRSEAEWSAYRESLATVKNNKRYHLVRSRTPISFLDVKGGHLFMNENFEMVDPTEEAARIGIDLSNKDRDLVGSGFNRFSIRLLERIKRRWKN